MKSVMKWYRNRYVVLVLALFVTLLGIYHFSKEISGIVAERSAADMYNNTSIFTMYFNDFMEEHISRLEETASLLGETVLADEEAAKKILKEKQRDFTAYAILYPTGEKAYGSDDVSLNFNLVKSEYLDTLVKDKKTLVYGNSVQDDDKIKYMAVCTPVIYNGEARAVLTGLIRMNTLSEVLQRWEVAQDGCAFFMTLRGNYLAGSERFEDLLGKEAGDFMTYIVNCRIKSGNFKEDDIYKAVQQKKDVMIQYDYEGEGYVACLSPVTGTDWFIGYMDKEKEFHLSTYSLGKKTLVFLWLAVILWVLVLVYTVCLIWHYGKEKEQMERYETISKLDKSILLEMQFSPKKLCFFGDVKEMFHVNTNILRGEEVYEIYNKVHPEDVSVRKRLHQFFEDTAEVFSAEVRIETEKGKYGWFRITGTLIKDSHTGLNQKFIAKLESADEEIADEKNLMERAENDLLTGVLNKKTMEERVVESLKNIPSSSYRIFFMVDLDNFKNVNDKLGHIMGDKAIVDTATRLSEIFRRDAYVGRLGGDEFAVCASYVAFDEESLYKFITKKAEKICEANRRTYVNGDMAVDISSSVGIAIAPDMAADFETLYKKADSALYQSKNGGKNCYHIFGRDV